jgi:hypothetical protein
MVSRRLRISREVRNEKKDRAEKKDRQKRQLVWLVDLTCRSLPSPMYATTAFTMVCWWPSVWQKASSSGAAVQLPRGIELRGLTL